MKGLALACVAAAGGLAAPAAAASEAMAGMHRLERVEPPLRTFDRTVLGNLQDPKAVANAEVPRGHSFVATVEVGTPPQSLRCLLDTGGADMWLPSKKCVDCRGDERHFHAERSTSFMPAVTRTPRGYLPVPVRVDYGSGDVAGFLVQDIVRLGLQSFVNQSFIIVEEERLPRHRNWDGICGLGWRQMAKAGNPLYQTHLKEGDHAIFTLVPGPDRHVYVAVGQVPYKACAGGHVAFAPAEPILPGQGRSYWVSSGELHVDSTNGFHKSWKARFVVDSGTQFFLAPRKQYAAFLRALLPLGEFDHFCGVDAAAGGLVICDCAIMQKGPSSAGIRVAVSGRSFRLDIGKLFRRVPATGGGELCLLQVQQNAPLMPEPMRAIGELLGFKGPPSAAEASAPPPPARSSSVPFDLPDGFAKSNVVHPADTLAHKTGSVPITNTEHVDVTTQQMLDGTVCVTRKVTAQGHVVSNVTTCSEPQATLVRRLSARAEPEDPSDNVWILGGAFLEHFVVVLDFEQRRLGFAEPAYAAPSEPEASAKPPAQPTVVASDSLRAVRAPQVVAAPVFGRKAPARPTDILSGGISGGHRISQFAEPHQVGSFPWGVGALAAILVAGAAAGTTLCKKMNRRKMVSQPAASAEAEEDPHEPMTEGQDVVDDAAE